MIARYRLVWLVSAAVIMGMVLAACRKPAEEAPPVAIAEAPAPTPVGSPPAEATAGAPQIEPSGPPPAPQIAVTTIRTSDCTTIGNDGDITVIDWQPSDSRLPAEIRWFAPGKPPGYRVVITPLTGPAQQSPDAARQQKLLAMFDARYEIGPGDDSVLSKLPQYPPFASSEARWYYQVQVLDAEGKPVCAGSYEVCVREPGGCQYLSRVPARAG